MSMVYARTSLGGFFFDATISESHDFENTITENPVQTGANVNDHLFHQPIKVTLQLFQSDCIASIVKGQFAKGTTRSISAVDQLYKFFWDGTIMTLQTSLKNYPAMVIKSCIINKDATTQTAIKATVILQQLITVNAVAKSVVDADTTDNGAVTASPGSDEIIKHLPY